MMDRIYIKEERKRENIRVSPHMSPSLNCLEDLPFDPVESACFDCPSATWYMTSKALKCYCKWMYVDIWETGKDLITICDGRELSIAGLEEDMSS